MKVFLVLHCNDKYGTYVSSLHTTREKAEERAYHLARKHIALKERSPGVQLGQHSYHVIAKKIIGKIKGTSK